MSVSTAGIQGTLGRLMSQFRIVHSAVHAAIAGLCWLALSHLSEFEDLAASSLTFFGEHKHYAVPVLIALLALLFRLSDKLSNAFVEKVPLVSWALRRALSGRGFIEGDWPLAVYDMANQKLLYLGFLTITFKGGQIYVYGDDWAPSGEHAQAFHSVQSLYHDHTLQYWYEQGASLHKPDMRGYTEIYFFPVGGTALRHAGKFLDPKHTSDIRFYAVRQAYGFFERRFSTPEQKISAARKLWTGLEPRLATLKGRDISTDFA